MASNNLSYYPNFNVFQIEIFLKNTINIDPNQLNIK